MNAPPESGKKISRIASIFRYRGFQLLVPMCDLVGSVLLDNNLCCVKWIGWKLAEIAEAAWPVRELGKATNLGIYPGSMLFGAGRQVFRVFDRTNSGAADRKPMRTFGLGPLEHGDMRVRTSGRKAGAWCRLPGNWR